ncbi:hypothetical protein INT45_004131 [Circinella minor]|uniref:Uncharacterized protein n=1 Tax=Circinella minor TaxID=1195481 RepID=A0A8H7VDZ7_9FUNG|nr:hypothetical protein INT45_004131 [Circinella minor]
MNHLSSSCPSSPSNTKRKTVFKKSKQEKPQQQIIIQEPNPKETNDISFPDNKLMDDYYHYDHHNDNSLLSPEPSPLSCHPTDAISARPSSSLLQKQSQSQSIDNNELSYNRNIFKNNRETRLSFQTESRTYHRRVSFDSTTSLNTSDQQHVVLRQASDGFERTRRSRIFLIPINMDLEIFDGVKFTLLDLVDENDEIIAVGIYTQGVVLISYHSIFSHLLKDTKLFIYGINVIYPDISAQTKADELMKKIMEYHQGDKIDIYEPSMVIIASHKRTTKPSYEFSGTGIFKSGLKRCMTPIIFVPTQSYLRRASTGDIFTRHPYPSITSSQDDMNATVVAASSSSSSRSVSEPQVYI